MSLALADDGALYVGTNGEAIVVRLAAPGRAEVVHDFPGNEVTSLAFRAGQLAVAANDMPEAPAPVTGGAERGRRRGARDESSAR